MIPSQPQPSLSAALIFLDRPHFQSASFLWAKTRFRFATKKNKNKLTFNRVRSNIYRLYNPYNPTLQ